MTPRLWLALWDNAVALHKSGDSGEGEAYRTLLENSYYAWRFRPASPWVVGHGGTR